VHEPDIQIEWSYFGGIFYLNASVVNYFTF